MAEDIIPNDVRQFILHNIDSIAQMECLLLFRSNRETEWTAEAMAKGLYVSEDDAAAILAQLQARGFLATSQASPLRYKYQPQSPEMEEITGRMADLYSHYLVPVTHLIHSKPKNRVQEFADAFLIRKD
jgi:hypothetical protein